VDGDRDGRQHHALAAEGAVAQIDRPLLRLLGRHGDGGGRRLGAQLHFSPDDLVRDGAGERAVRVEAAEVPGGDELPQGLGLGEDGLRPLPDAVAPVAQARVAAVGADEGAGRGGEAVGERQPGLGRNVPIAAAEHPRTVAQAVEHDAGDGRVFGQQIAEQVAEEGEVVGGDEVAVHAVEGVLVRAVAGGRELVRPAAIAGVELGEGGRHVPDELLLQLFLLPEGVRRAGADAVDALDGVGEQLGALPVVHPAVAD
jgi:hypothetical protein